MRVKFIYLIVPKYRVPLFDALIAHPGWDVTVHATPAVPGLASTAVESDEHYKVTDSLVTFLGGRLRWMKGIMDFSDLKRGDVLVIWGDPRFLNALPLMLKCKRKGVKSVWWGQGFTPYSTGRVWLRQWFMKYADAVMLYTDREVQRYKEMGYHHPMVFAKNNALDQTSIQDARESTTEDQINAVRKQYGLVPGKTMVTVGRLIPKMQLEIALRAMTDEKLADYRLLVVGKGEQQQIYEDLATELKVRDRVHFLGPIYEDSDLAPVLMASDVFVFPGAIGLAVFHAFGFGLPIVTHSNENDHGPEFAAIQNGVNGELFEENSVADFIRAITTVHDSQSIKNYKQTALDTVLNDWNMKNTVDRFVQAIDTVANVTRSQ